MPLTTTLLSAMLAASVPNNLPDRVTYCTEVGPINLNFAQAKVEGDYRIILPDREFGGELAMQWVDGYLAGTWTDTGWFWTHHYRLP